MSRSSSTPDPVLRVAVGQAAATCGDPVANAANAADLAARARAAGARLLVLPEAFLTGYCREAFGGPLPSPAELPDLLAPVLAAADGTTVVLSSPLARDGRRTLSQVVLTGDGRILAPYDKQHLSGYETEYFTPGTHGASVRVDGWNLGLSVCYDGSFPEHAAASAADGDLGYLNSAAFFPGGAHRQELYMRARALDNGFFVVHAGLSGTCGPETFIGGSAVLDPEGRTLVRAGEGEELLVADLDVALLHATRAAHPMHADRRASLGERTRV